MNSKKPGRNALCPCGSGKKFKRCHGAIRQASHPYPRPIPKEVMDALQRHQVEEHNRRIQQGLGRPIISTVVNGVRTVAVGGSVYGSKDWKTFVDFLITYIKIALTQEWFDNELKKPLAERNPILQWYESLVAHQKRTRIEPGKVVSAPMTGAVAAYVGLAYNLYLLAHNVDVQKRLIERLKNPKDFHGAYYESFVAASFIGAGFNLTMENEGDSTTTHCEFTAVHSVSGRSYSVEAKARHISGVLGADRIAGTVETSKIKIGRKLGAALAKKAAHQRVVFIDVNEPDIPTDGAEVAWRDPVLNSLRELEGTMTIDGRPAPEAYVFITNMPFHHHTESTDFRVAAALEGFKIPDLKPDATFPDLRAALASRDAHGDITKMMDYFRAFHIPTTFDGSIPEYTFGQITDPRLIVGKRYSLPQDDGGNIFGTLTSAVVLKHEKKIYGTYTLDDGRSVIMTCPMSDAEFAVYERYPDTFFGIHRSAGRVARDPIELYDHFFESYKNSTKEKLLEFLQGVPDFGELEAKSQSDLAEIYCERMVYRHMAEHPEIGQPQPSKKE